MDNPTPGQPTPGQPTPDQTPPPQTTTSTTTSTITKTTSPPLDGKETVRSAIGKAIVLLLHPIPLTALIVVCSLIYLIFCDIEGTDKGQILEHLSQLSYARGLITYLFAVGTIGAVVVLIMAALLDDGQYPDRFQRAKEVLSLLIGLFGSIIGFYFGSQSQGNQAIGIQIAEPMVPRIVKADTGFTYVTHVEGGQPPYTFAIRVGTNAVSKPIIEGTTFGWINETIPATWTIGTNTLTLRLDVSDSHNDQSFVLTEVSIQ